MRATDLAHSFEIGNSEVNFNLENKCQNRQTGFHSECPYNFHMWLLTPRVGHWLGADDGGMGQSSHKLSCNYYHSAKTP